MIKGLATFHFYLEFDLRKNLLPDSNIQTGCWRVHCPRTVCLQYQSLSASHVFLRQKIHPKSLTSTQQPWPSNYLPCSYLLTSFSLQRDSWALAPNTTIPYNTLLSQVSQLFFLPDHLQYRQWKHKITIISNSQVHIRLDNRKTCCRDWQVV